MEIQTVLDSLDLEPLARLVAEDSEMKMAVSTLEILNCGLPLTYVFKIMPISNFTTLRILATKSPALRVELSKDFIGFDSLERLSFSGMDDLTFVQEAAISDDGNALSNLKTLEIINAGEMNRVPMFPKFLGNLQTLIMKSNDHLTLDNSTDESPFTNLVNLKSMDLGDNPRLTGIPEMIFASNENLETLDLRSNRIQRLHPKSFYGTKSLTKIYLGRNEFVTVPASLFNYSSNLKEIDWTADSPKNGGRHFPVGLFSSLKKLEKFSYSFRSLPLKLNLGDASMAFKNSPNFRSLAIRNTLLNRTDLLDDGFINGLVNLKTLNLTDNRLQTLSVGDLPASLNKIWLSGNNFNCSCETLTALDFYQSLIQDYHSIRIFHCANSNGMGVSVQDAMSRTSCLSETTIIWMLVSLVIVALFVILGIALYLKRVELYNHRLTEKILFPEEAANHEEVFDVFILYASPDRSTAELFYSQLSWELRHSHCRRFKCAIDERDFIVGDTIHSNMTRITKKSKRVVALLSDSFLNDGHCVEALEEVPISKLLVVFLDQDDHVNDVTNIRESLESRNLGPKCSSCRKRLRK